MMDAPSRTLTIAAPAIAAFAPMAVLGLSESSAPEIAGLTVAGGAVLSIALRATLWSELRRFDVVPVLAALLVVVALARLEVGAELLAGISSLGLLVWVAEDPSSAMPLRRVGSGLLIPSMALAIALATAVAVPVGRGSVGVAAILAALAIAAIGWFLARPERVAAPSPS